VARGTDIEIRQIGYLELKTRRRCRAQLTRICRDPLVLLVTGTLETPGPGRSERVILDCGMWKIDEASDIIFLPSEDRRTFPIEESHGRFRQGKK
jgi:hypothetical protein